MEATDRFGSVLTLRLLRRGNNDRGSSYSATASAAANGRREKYSEAWNNTLVGTATEARKTSTATPSTDFAAGARLGGQEQTPLESGKQEAHAYLYQCSSFLRPHICGIDGVLKNRSYLQGPVFPPSSSISAVCCRGSKLVVPTKVT